MAKRKSMKLKKNLKVRKPWLALGVAAASLAVLAIAGQLYFAESRPSSVASSGETPVARPYEFKRYKVASKPALAVKKSAKKKMIAHKKKKRAVRLAGR